MRLLIIRSLAIGLLSCMPLFIWLGWKAQRSSETPLNISPVSGTRSPTAPVRQLNLYDAAVSGLIKIQIRSASNNSGVNPHWWVLFIPPVLIRVRS